MLINDASITGSLIVNASASFQNISLGGNIIPDETNLRNLGSTEKFFKEIYVSTGSINFVDGGNIIAVLSAGTITAIQSNTSSANSRLVSIESVSASLQAFTASVSTTNTFTSSATARLNALETTSASVDTLNTNQNNRLSALETTSASVDTLNTNQNSRLSSLEIKTGSLATTGSNTFIGTQTITGSLFISANLVVQGTSSLQNITASAVSIGTNLINLNTANPAIRYAGLVIGDSGSVGGSGSFLYDSVQDEFIFVHRGANTTVTSSVVLMGPQTYDSIGNETYLTNNRIPKGAGNEHLGDSNITDTGTIIRLSTDAEITGSLTLTNGIVVPNSKIKIGAYIGTTGDDSIAIGYGPAAAGSSTIAIGYNPLTNHPITFTPSNNSIAIGYNPKAGGNNSIAIGYTAKTFFPNSINIGDAYYASGSTAWVTGSFGIGGAPESGYVLTLKGNGVDSPLLLLQGLANPTAKLGDTTTGTSDVGNLWLYNDGTLRVRLDSDTAGTSYINANKFVVGATESTNAKFRVRHDDTDATYTSKIQAVFGPSDYLDSDSANVFGGGTSETQFTMGNASRPAMLSIGGNINVDEALGVINFFRSNNTDGYRSRIQIFAQGQSTGTANQHGAYLEFRTANDGVANPAALLQLEARGALRIFRRDDNMTFPDSVGAFYVRQNGNHAGTEEEFRIVGRNIGFFSHTGTRHAGINSSGVLGIGYAGTPAATSKIFISRSDQYGLHLDAGTGYARIQTTDDNLYLKVGSNDMITINSSAITLTSTVTPSNVSTPNFTILETGVSKTVTGYGYDATQPMAMVITQTAQTTMGLMRASEDTVGSTLRGMKARGNASTIASPLNGDDIFSVEGWAWHGSGPNYPKLGGGMKFVKDDNWGTANTRAPMRTEFYNANSTTTTQTTLIIYPSGNASLTGTLTQSASDIRLKTNITKIENALDKINQLEGFTYNWNTISPLYNSNVTNKEVGLSAQAVREVLPEVVSLAPFDVDNLDGKTSKSGQNYLTVNYEKLVPLLIEGIKELKAENNSLQLQIDELRNK